MLQRVLFDLFTWPRLGGPERERNCGRPDVEPLGFGESFESVAVTRASVGPGDLTESTFPVTGKDLY